MKHPQPTNPGVEQATPAVVQNPTTAPVPKHLTGKRLAEARRLLGLTQQQAAEKGGVSQRDVSELESDTKVFIPSTYLAFLGLNSILLNAIFNSELDLSLSAVVQNATTAEGTGSTLYTEELQARNAALEENALHMEAELRRREEQLVEAGKAADVLVRQCQALREANSNLLGEVDELQQRDKARAEEMERVREVNKKNADGYYAAKLLANEAEDKAIALEADNTRLRTALLEQATVFATTLKALLPEA